MRMSIWLPVFALTWQAEAALASDRVELSVRLVQLSDGARRFGVPMVIDGRPVEAGLDTGSTGLRVMARALPGNTAKGAPVHYGYGSGTRLDGPLVTVSVAFGGVAGTVRSQRVDGLSCTAEKRNCPVRRNDDPASFGIQGDGLPGEGFAAILGVNLRSASAPNPFEALGVRRWIVELPRPGEATPGRLILNPTNADIAGFSTYRLLGDDNSLAACLAGPQPLGRFCAPATIDSGAPGIFVFDAAAHGRVPNETPVTLTLGDGGGQASANLVTGRRDQASNLVVSRPEGREQPSMHLGIAPYWRWSVLYDADAHRIGFKPR